LELIITAAAEILLNFGQPSNVKVQHPIGPECPAVRVASVRLSRIHQHHRASADALLRTPVQIGTATVRDDANGERFMCVLAVTDFATVLNGTRFHKRQRLIAPERWLG
jgi:hypothetical protein